MLNFGPRVALRTLGEPFRWKAQTEYGTFDIPDATYLDHVQQAAPVLTVDGAAWPGLKEGSQVVRLRGGKTYRVAEPPRAIDDGALQELVLQEV